MSHPVESITTNTVAVASLTISWWLPILKSASDLAGLILPILVAIFWIVHIAVKVQAYRKGRGGE